MPASLKIEDDGFLDLHFPAANGADPLICTIDIELAAQAFFDANQNTDPNDAVAWASAFREAGKKIGLPDGLSQNALHRIAKECWRLTKELAKKDVATPSSD